MSLTKLVTFITFPLENIYREHAENIAVAASNGMIGGKIMF